MGEGSFDDDGFDPGVPVPAPDRLWRHPAERGAEQAAVNLASRSIGRRWPSMLVSFIAGATVVGMTWLLSESPEQPTENVVSTFVDVPSVSETPDTGPLPFDEWMIEISQDNKHAVVGLHLGGDVSDLVVQAILYRNDGYLISSAHALDGAEDIRAVLADSTALPAEIVAADRVSGIAILKIASPEIATAKFSSGRVARQDRLVAISANQSSGTPRLSAVDVRDDGYVGILPNGDLLSDLFLLSDELDASWAGAPIVDELGGVVAMVVTGRDGVNYAIPTEFATDIAMQLIDTGEVEHVPWMGVELAAGLTDGLKERYGTPGGVLVTKVWHETPAAQAGLVAGDVITGFDTVNVMEREDLRIALRASSPGDRVELRFKRIAAVDSPQLLAEDLPVGEDHSTTITLGAKPLT